MIKTPGRLSVRTIHGRNGPFNVGRLATSIGEFVIKDPQLEQFSEGQFSGEFLLLEIRPASYVAGGRMVIEVRAKIGEMLLTDDGVLVSQTGPSFDSAELDPLEEEAEPLPPVKAPPQPFAKTPPAPLTDAPSLPAPPVQNEAMDDNDPDVELFGLLWPLGKNVKLDPTIDRAVFRSQVKRIKELGYKFQSSSQTWHAAA